MPWTKNPIGIWEIGMWVGEESNLPFCSCYDNGDELLNNGLKGSLLAIGNSNELHHLLRINISFNCG